MVQELQSRLGWIALFFLFCGISVFSQNRNSDSYNLNEINVNGTLDFYLLTFNNTTDDAIELRLFYYDSKGSSQFKYEKVTVASGNSFSTMCYPRFESVGYIYIKSDKYVYTPILQGIRSFSNKAYGVKEMGSRDFYEFEEDNLIYSCLPISAAYYDLTSSNQIVIEPYIKKQGGHIIGNWLYGVRKLGYTYIVLFNKSYRSGDFLIYAYLDQETYDDYYPIYSNGEWHVFGYEINDSSEKMYVFEIPNNTHFYVFSEFACSYVGINNLQKTIYLDIDDVKYEFRKMSADSNSIVKVLLKN